MLKLTLCLLMSAGPLLAAGEEKDLSFPGLGYPIQLRFSPSSQGRTCFRTGYSDDPGKEYDTVLVQGMMPDGAMSLEVEGKGDTIFSGAVRYERDGFRRFPNGRFWARYRAPARTSRRLRVSVTDLGLKGPASVVVYGTELLTSGELREEAVPASTAPYAPDPSLFVPSTAPFSLVRRAQWGAAPPKEPYTPIKQYFFTLHHTQGHYPRSYGDSVTEMQFIQDYHQHAKGWNDIGYHFLIDPEGRIFEGRPIGVQGAHVLRHNPGNIGISIMGNYHPPANDVFTPETRRSFVTLGSYIRDNYSVGISSFYAHRDLGDTDCPGDGLYAQKASLAAEIFTPLPPPPAPALPPAGDLPPAQSESLRQLLLYLGRD